MMNGDPMQMFNHGDESALRQLMPVKLKQIRKQSRRGRKIYCETNHAFIKGWGYLIPEFIPQEEIGVIILHRDVEQVIYDFIRDYRIPGTTMYTRTFHLIPGSPRNLSAPPAQAAPYDLWHWYINEIYLRAEQYRRMFPKIRYVECDVEQLNEYAFVVDMLASFGLVPTPQLQEAVGVRMNTRDNYPKRPLDDLLAVSPYPCADSLAPGERDQLITAMITYLREQKARELAHIQPNRHYLNTMVYGIRRCVGYAQQELEEVFQYSLKFTETQDILWMELLWTIRPNDPAFFVYERSGPPGLSYTAETNVIPSLTTAVRKLGVQVIFQKILLMLRGQWNHDPTHRIHNPWKTDRVEQERAE
ncbi:MAG: hypothetical protein GY801_35175 [bacterium]|nr:hypothetical protein [bacterium]